MTERGVLDKPLVNVCSDVKQDDGVLVGRLGVLGLIVRHPNQEVGIFLHQMAEESDFFALLLSIASSEKKCLLFP